MAVFARPWGCGTRSIHHDQRSFHRRPSPRKKKHSRSAHHNGRRHINRTAALHSIQEQAATAIDGVAEQLTKLKEKGMQSSQAMAKAILSNPKSSVMLAFGVGYLIARVRRWL